MLTCTLERFQEASQVLFAKERIQAVGEKVGGTGSQGHQGRRGEGGLRAEVNSHKVKLYMLDFSANAGDRIQYVIFFFFKIWSWERDPRSAFLRVLVFLNLSEVPKARDHQPEPWIYESHLTILRLGFQSRLAFLLALETFTQSISEIYFLQAQFPKRILKEKMFRKIDAKKSQEGSSQCLKKAVNYACKPTAFVVYLNKM